MAALAERMQDTIAPDLARFDRRTSVKQAYSQERHRVKAKPMSRAQGRVSIRPFSVFAFLTAFTVLFLIVYSYMSVSEINSKNEQMRKELTKYTNENAVLQKEYENRISLTELAEIAARDYGMVKPERSKITYLDLSGEDKVTVIKKPTLLSQATVFFGEKMQEFLVYLG